VLERSSSFFHGHQIAYAAQPETHLPLCLSFSDYCVIPWSYSTRSRLLYMSAA
jgi:hypothetical protein